jgi:hypothetical protein
MDNSTLSANLFYGDGSGSDVVTVAGEGGGFVVGAMVGLGTNIINSSTITVNNLADFNDGALSIGNIVGVLQSAANFTQNSWTLANINVSGGNNVGGFIGKISGSTSIGGLTGLTNAINVSATSTGASTLNVGGVAGLVENSSLNNTFTNTGVITGILQMGGLFGSVTGSTLLGTYNNTSGSVTIPAIYGVTPMYAGGLIGRAIDTNLDGSFTNNGNVTAKSYVGGLFGSIEGTSIISSTALMSSTGGLIQGSNYVAGIAGSLGSAVTDNATSTFTNNSTVYANDIVGGIAGGIFGVSTASSVGNTLINTGTIHSTGISGGIVGSLIAGSITGDLTNSGEVKAEYLLGTDMVAGGIIGHMTGGTLGHATNSSIASNTGNITGSNFVGGVIGEISGTASFTAHISLEASTGTITSGSSSGIGAFSGGIIGYINGTTVDVAMNSLASLSIVTALNSLNAAGGLIGKMTDATLGDTTIKSNHVTNFGSSVNVGGIVGALEGNSSINNTNLFSDAMNSPLDTNVGSVIGKIFNANYSTSLNAIADVTGGNTVGGIVGWVDSSILGGSFTNASYGVSGNSNAGGLFGLITNSNISATLTNYSSVNGINYTGGIVGELSDSTLSGAISFSDGGDIISALGQGAGFVAGRMTGNNTVSSTTITVDTLADFNDNAANVGGIVGVMEGNGSLIQGNWLLPDINVAGGHSIGGLIGKMLNATLVLGSLNSVSNVTGDTAVGGLIGSAYGSSTNQNLTVTHDVLGNTQSGGILGLSDQSNLLGVNLFYGTVTGSSDTGGIIGKMQNGSLLQKAGNIGTIQGGTNTGGIVGNLLSGTLSLAYNNSNNTVTGTNFTGGIVGLLGAAGNINNVLFGGTLNASTGTVGGIAGSTAVGSTITKALSVGYFNTAGAGLVGALVGNNAGTINTSFFDTRAYANGVGFNSGTNGGVGKNTSAVLKGPTLYTNVGWNFASIWDTSAGNYPILRFCTVDCSVPLRTDPPTPPTPLTPQLITDQIQQVITAAELEGIPNPYEWLPDAERPMVKITQFLSIHGPLAGVIPESLVLQYRAKFQSLGIGPELLEKIYVTDLNTDHKTEAERLVLQDNVQQIMNQLFEFYSK